jgi:putative transposase
VKYAFIQRHRRVWPISVQCRVLQVSVTGYHEHFMRRASNAQRRHLSDDALLVHIKAIHAETRGGYGWPRTWKELLARGIRVGKDRVQKLMQLHGIRARGKRRFKVTTDSKHDLPIAANLLNQAFAVSEPDKVWVGDITYIATDEGWLFLAVVIDLFSRQVVGWSLRQDMTRELVIDALRMAWFKRHPGKDAGLIFHSDRGSQYASKDYRDVLTEYGITASMSRRGNCWDNACSETLFGSLKVERLHGQRFKSRRQAKDEVVAWLLWYNRTRLHSTLAYTSPMQFEEAWLASQPRRDPGARSDDPQEESPLEESERMGDLRYRQHGWKPDELPDFATIRRDQPDSQRPESIEKTYQADLAIIGALLSVIKGDPPFQKHPEFQSEAKLILVLEQQFDGYAGCKRRTLEKRFKAAKDLLKLP